MSIPISPYPLAIILFAFISVFIAGFLVWYALRRNDGYGPNSVTAKPSLS